jgi:UDP-N-acetylmuramoyl-L-alanyl-D-glutamate--2,6-diaminopimelate ligase
MLAPSRLAEALGGALELRLVGEVFAENALAAACAAHAVGTRGPAIVRGLAGCAGVPGRFELLSGETGPVVAVDYAHTPDALARTCATARALAGTGRVIVVFGAGGDTDAGKRGPMGEAVGAAADVAVVTTDNPRHEDPREIAAMPCARGSSAAGGRGCAKRPIAAHGDRAGAGGGAGRRCGRGRGQGPRDGADDRRRDAAVLGPRGAGTLLGVVVARRVLV